MFASYQHNSQQKGVYAASIADTGGLQFAQVVNSPEGFSSQQPFQISRGSQQLNLYAPPLSKRDYVAVYDELHVRCMEANLRSPEINMSTLCQFNCDARDSTPKNYSLASDPNLDLNLNWVFERHCLTNSSQDTPCTGLAVDTQGISS